MTGPEPLRDPLAEVVLMATIRRAQEICRREAGKLEPVRGCGGCPTCSLSASFDEVWCILEAGLAAWERLTGRKVPPLA